MGLKEPQGQLDAKMDVQHVTVEDTAALKFWSPHFIQLLYLQRRT
jgi:hypothetical protein